MNPIHLPYEATRDQGEGCPEHHWLRLAQYILDTCRIFKMPDKCLAFTLLTQKSQGRINSITLVGIVRKENDSLKRFG